MAEYIDREEVYKNACKRCKNHGIEVGSCFSEEPCEVLILAFVNAPSADVATVRHGRWIFEPDGGTRCRECNKRVRDVTGGLNAPVDLSALPYGPKCGAKMDGGEHDA